MPNRSRSHHPGFISPHLRIPGAHRSARSGVFKLLLAFSLVFFNAAIEANPVGPVVTQGAATFDG
jgi:hypothetical protein